MTYFGSKVHPNIKGSLSQFCSCLDKPFRILRDQIPVTRIVTNAAASQIQTQCMKHFPKSIEALK